VGIKNYVEIRYPKYGFAWRVRCQSYEFWKLFELEKIEPNCLNFLSNICKRGQTIFDVGSWIGPYTLFFSKLAGMDGKIVAFEPSPASFKILLDNLRENRLSNVICENVALGNSVGIVKLYTYYEKGSETSMVRYGNESELKAVGRLKTFSVRCTTIDKYCRDNNITPNGIKVDVEGAEGLVIEGATRIIKSCSPWALVEFHRSFMSEHENIRNWEKITKYAKELKFIAGDDKKYGYMDEIISEPDGNFHMFVQY